MNKRSDTFNDDADAQGNLINPTGAGVKYNFGNIQFENQPMSAEEQELFNQL